MTENKEKEFEGELSWISPKQLISEDSHDRVESFFLGLAVFFNDLKGFIFLEKALVESYRRPEFNEVSVHSGNYGGVLVQTKRFLSSIISEFFVLLRENQDIIMGGKFQEILKKIPRSEQELWNGLNSAALGEFTQADKLLKALFKIRNNITFHYDHSGKQLRTGFISRFFGNYQDAKNEKAFYSTGNSIGVIRYYFADAAAEEAFFLAIGKGFKEISYNDEAIKEFNDSLHDAILATSGTISSLLKKYIATCRSKPK